MHQEEVELALMAFIREEFLWGDENRELTTSTPLLEWGILDSLRTAVLLSHIREALGVFVSPARVNADNFRDVSAISALVVSEAAEASEAAGPDVTTKRRA